MMKLTGDEIEFSDKMENQGKRHAETQKNYRKEKSKVHIHQIKRNHQATQNSIHSNSSR